MSPGDVLRLLALFLGIYAALYALSAAINAPKALLLLLRLVGTETVGDAAVCGNVAWYPVPECTGIFGVAIWLSLALYFRFPRRSVVLGALVAFVADILRVLLSVAIGCALQSTLPHTILWLLTPGIVLILWRHYYPRARSPVV